MCGGLSYGASRARTGDLLHAMQALSQLSYSPEVADHLSEVVVGCHVDAEPLVVARRRQAQMDVRRLIESLDRKQERPPELVAVQGERVDLVSAIPRADVAVAVARDVRRPARITSPTRIAVLHWTRRRRLPRSKTRS